MTVSSDAQATPLPKPNGVFAAIDVKTGCWTEHGLTFLNSWWNFMSGMNRIIPCDATGTNVVTLTPVTTAPLIEKYVSYEIYAFTAENNSTGAVTATVTPRSGSLDTLKVFKGATQATSSDLVAGVTYLLIYADYLDSGAGGFIIK
jgi:hypothetical protein